MEAWQRFLDLEAAVLSWSEEKRAMAAKPLSLPTMAIAKHALQEYAAAAKTVKYAAKNVGEMARELNAITQVASAGDLPDRLHEAETRKTETETNITEKVSSTRALILRT